jgi:hypothetical protein
MPVHAKQWEYAVLSRYIKSIAAAHQLLKRSPTL